MATQALLLVLLCTATTLYCATDAKHESNKTATLEEPSPRTLYGTPQEKFAQLLAYKKLKAAVKTLALECHKRSFCQTARALGMSHPKTSPIASFMRGAAEMNDSFLTAFAKGWTGQNCTKEFRSCDSAKDYVERLVGAIANTKSNMK